jgi:hypothetical protein
MDRLLFFVNDQIISTPIINNSNVEIYDIALDTRIQPQKKKFIIPNTFEKKNDIILNKKIIILFKKLNSKQQAIFGDCIYLKRTQFDKLIHLFLIGGARCSSLVLVH